MPKKLWKMLVSADSPYIVPLMRLIETQSKPTIAKWRMDYCEVVDNGKKEKIERPKSQRTVAEI